MKEFFLLPNSFNVKPKIPIGEEKNQTIKRHLLF